VQVTDEEVYEARYQGHTAGQMLFGASLNPYPHNTQLYIVWDDARLNEIGRRLNSRVSLARAIC
jgi:hypothetical protein